MIDSQEKGSHRSAASSSIAMYPSIRRSEDTFAHIPHVGPVAAIDCSPFHRSLFISGGNDGVIRLFHILDRTPIREWTMGPPRGSGMLLLL